MDSQSKCGNGWLHRYKLVAQYTDCVHEVCEVCRKSAFFPVVGGRVDNVYYIKFHNRECLPKQHPLFNKEYGKA